MDLFRLAKAKYVNDLSGAGARIAGGRWNEKGTAVLYTASSRALATVEYLVHVPLAIRPKGLSMATLSVPDSVPQAKVDIADLPPNWMEYPSPSALASLGSEWAAANSELLLFVPSAVVLEECNVLINPLHPDMKHVRIIGAEAHRFDPRLLR